MFLVSTCSCRCEIYWSQVLSGEWRCSWSSADRRCSSYIWVINNLIAHLSASYIRYLTVYIIPLSRVQYVTCVQFFYLVLSNSYRFILDVIKSSVSEVNLLQNIHPFPNSLGIMPLSTLALITSVLFAYLFNYGIVQHHILWLISDAFCRSVS